MSCGQRRRITKVALGEGTTRCKFLSELPLSPSAIRSRRRVTTDGIEQCGRTARGCASQDGVDILGNANIVTSRIRVATNDVDEPLSDATHVKTKAGIGPNASLRKFF